MRVRFVGVLKVFLEGFEGLGELALDRVEKVLVGEKEGQLDVLFGHKCFIEDWNFL